ncbi:hypothetical protein PsYK624_108130 [Phanerochaete sordida]|uniref:Uncharacterized protein n=1 Tax=Phanerochaete sordida TaxID=48140 RepID=A0A9P3GFC0_9APHY|nr:hypothetical protein PsYK624_108130 [Phanerochaete sordida]
MLPQIPRTSAKHAGLRVPRRTMSTLLEEPSSSSRTGRSSAQFGAHRDENKDMTHVYIRPADGVKSTREAYAILRGLERRYGRLKWYRMFRDTEVSDFYQPYIFAQFDSEEALAAIPLGRQTVPLEIPIFERAQTGGISLEDLRDLLHPADKVENDPIPVFTPKEKGTPNEQVAAATEATPEPEATPHDSETGEETSPTPAPTTKVINVFIERSAKRRDFSSNTTFNLSRVRRMEVQRSFAKWGGFYEPPPPPQPISEEDRAFGVPQPPPRPVFKRKHMDDILEKWAPTFEAERQEVEAAARAETEAAEREAAAKKAVAEAAAVEAKAVAAAAAEEAAAQLEAAADAEAEVESEQVPQSAKPAQPRISKKRERILELARQNAFAAQAQTPQAAATASTAPAASEANTQEKAEVVAEQKADGEQKVEGEQKPAGTMRDRLWKFMGGKWM